MAWKLLQQDHLLALQVILHDKLPWSLPCNMLLHWMSENCALVIALQHAVLYDWKRGFAKVTACVLTNTEAAQHLLHG